MIFLSTNDSNFLSLQCGPDSNGGFMNDAFAYIKNNGGLDTEESYPYEGKDGQCRYKTSDIGAKDVGFKNVPSGDENALKFAIATQVDNK